MTVLLKENERVDDLGRRGYKIIQNSTKFCFGVDAALLAWFAEVRPGEKILDLGTGTGIVPILMDARNNTGDYTGLEIQEEMVEMANRSVELNEISDHVRMVQGDIKKASETFGKAMFHVVTSNPPYMAVGNGLTNPDLSKALARHEIMCTLEDVVREAAAVLVPGGRFYMVHRPSRLPEILHWMNTYKLAPSKLVTVHPFVDREATMILISGTKNGHDILHIGEPVIIYESENNYTAQIKKIYDDDYRNK